MTNKPLGLALAKAVRITAYYRADPLAIRLEFQTDEDRVDAANAIDDILREAFNAARARMEAALAERRAGRKPAKVCRVRVDGEDR